MILRASDVVDLQYILMDSARRYASSATQAARDDLLSSAAALDYVLLVASENGDEAFQGAEPVAESTRGTMLRAAVSALDFAACVLAGPQNAIDDFVDHHAREGGLFDVLRSLRRNGVLVSDEVTFRALTLASDLNERRSR
jgi:hypothetical protein